MTKNIWNTCVVRKTLGRKSKNQTCRADCFDGLSRNIGRGISGKTEIEVAAELEMEMRKNGAEAVAFESIVASADGALCLMRQPSDRVIGKGELVIIDYGCRVDGYHSDETVTCITGKPSAEQKMIYKVVYEAHMQRLMPLKPVLRAREIDAVARRSIEAAGFGNYFLHGLGHGVGLEIHESPFLSPRQGERWKKVWFSR